jgi:hypothetical protein
MSSFVQCVRLRKVCAKCEIKVRGIGGCTKGTVSESVDCELNSVDMRCSQPVVFKPYVMDQVTGNPPQQRVTIGDWPKLKGLTLADRQCDTPGTVDMLIGADLYPQILLNGMIKSPNGKLIPQKTVFGWIVSGKVGRVVGNDFVTADTNTDDILRRFWEVETVQPRKAWSLEEKECERHFEKTCVRDDDGRYVVTFPFEDGPDRAVSHLQQVKRKPGRDPDLKQQYSNVVDEYFQLHHAEKVP